MASSHQISIQKRYLCDVVERESPIMDVQPTSLQQLCDTVTSIWIKMNVCSSSRVQPYTISVYLLKWPVSHYSSKGTLDYYLIGSVFQ